MKKRIWMINPYCSPPEKETRLRTIKMAQYLQEDGYDVIIFCGSALHNSDYNYINNDAKYIKKIYNGIKFVQIKNRNYQSNMAFRLLSLKEFYVRLFEIYEIFEKPDLIIHVLTVPFGKEVKKIVERTNAKYFGEVLDLWPESFVEYGLINKANPILPRLRKIEKDFYYDVDELFFSMEGGKDYIIERKWDKRDYHPIDLTKVHYLNNGVDLQDFYYNLDNYQLHDTDLDNDNSYKIVYLGSIRLANDVKQIIDAVALLKEYKNIVLLIYGDGEERNNLEEYVKKHHFHNVVFKEKHIDIEYVPYVLSRSNLNILNYKQTNILRFGASQSKLFQYLASGKPICYNNDQKYNLISEYNLGVAKRFISNYEYANGLKEIINYSSERVEEISETSHQLVKQFDYKYLTKQLEVIIEKGK